MTPGESMPCAFGTTLSATSEVTQAHLAAQLGVAVGSVNWYLKRLIAKGFVKVTHLQRRRLRYLITPIGISEKARLTLSFMEVSFRSTARSAYSRTPCWRRSACGAISGCGCWATATWRRSSGSTCLEQETGVADGDTGGPYPAVVVSGDRLSLDWPGTEN